MCVGYIIRDTLTNPSPPSGESMPLLWGEAAVDVQGASLFWWKMQRRTMTSSGETTSYVWTL